MSCPPLIVAHRGASGVAPENTLAAFELAWEQGADAIEGDFRLSADGHIVCIHDADTKRTAGQDLSVAGSTLCELRKLDVGVWKGEHWRGQRIATLSEILASLPAGKMIFVEVKTGPEIVPALIATIQASPVQADQVLVMAFDRNVIRHLKSQVPELPAAWLCAFCQDESGDSTPGRDEVLETLAACGADGLGSSPEIPAEIVGAVRDAGFIHDVWTVDTLEIGEHFAALGSRAITTNYPDRLAPLRD